ncbi:site-specific DNA-methyltransferase [Lactococcus lactis]|uniref:DNA-methyltransferase n=1 Tax=Lactococcus lactis TaxID=1358 RepID=UPI0024186D51|nr:site-specific DNA-methyltransferase [Lactococcus lactis]MDG4966277.1 site-specific DNA-methyltransferase [Lactococcus lactis]
MIELNKIYNEDCLEGMKRIPDGSIDMILCDLPYGTTRNKWDSVLPFDKLWEQYERIIKDNGAIVLSAQTPFDKVLGASNLKLLRYEWIWEKTQGTGHLNANRMPLKNHENILVFYKNLPVYNPQFEAGIAYKTTSSVNSSNYGTQNESTVTVNDGFRYPLSIQEFKYDTETFHPTQKPVALFEYLIKTYTNKGDTVLDNCMGSGTTAIACINTERNFIGFETNEEYYNKSLQRIKNNVTQLDLFDEVEG